MKRFLQDVREIGGAVNGNPFITVDGRKVTFAVGNPDTLDVSDVAEAIAAGGAKGKIASGAPKGALRGIGGSVDLPASDESGALFVKYWEMSVAAIPVA